MARAAAKRKKRPQPPPGPRGEHHGGGGGGGSAKSIEDQLFFSRLRAHAKWAFALLAIVFAGSFVFLGVGSGNSGLGDVFQGLNIFGGSSGPDIEKLTDKVTENPTDAAARLALAEALIAEERRGEAIVEYQRYLTLRPRNLDVLSQLAALYEDQARIREGEVQAAFAARAAVVDRAEFGPAGTSPLGRALATLRDPIVTAVAGAGIERQTDAVNGLLQSRRAALSVYQKIAAVSPDDPTVLIQVASTAEQVCQISQAAAACPELQTALEAYQTFVKRFPDDTIVGEAKRRIKALQAQLRPAAAAAVVQGTSG